MIYLTRKEHFNAAHKLFNPNWTDEQNEAVFGKCANKNWHGHNFDLYVTLEGTPDSETGFVMDLKKMSNIIKREVIDILDHSNINMDVPFMAGKMASTENIAMGIWNQLEKHLTAENYRLYSIKLYETERNFVEYFGPQGRR
ncbi:MAG: 6-pyruvoyl tetrahydrobiopterin synthase [Sphingobacteriaceae bacterium]|nr:6-pyruvoyl tetrahydrobiopterin synthase [Sphingobacteriaceae bacterium]